MKTNEILQKDVQDAIKWEPLLHAAEIGVIVKDGIVTLTGTVDNYIKKIEAENATNTVLGVKGIIEKIEVRPDGSWSKSDTELTVDIASIFKFNFEIPKDKINILVEKGWVTLSGEVNWDFQRRAAVRAIGNLGIIGVTNNITVKSDLDESIEQKGIEDAISRDWATNNQDIQVKVSGTKVTLTGVVKAGYQKEEAERIAWKAPGVWNVDNQLMVGY